jgi:ATP-dependent Lon protease
MELPADAPVMVLPNATLFPRALLPLHIFELRYRRLLAEALAQHRVFIIAMQRPDRVRESPCPVAGLGFVRAAVKHGNGTSHLILQGLARVELGKAIQTKPFRVHSLRLLQPDDADSVRIDALVAKVHELAAERLKRGALAFSPPAQPLPASSKAGSEGGVVEPAEILRFFRSVENPEVVADLVSSALLPNALHRQAILETVAVEGRLRQLIKFLLAEIQRTQDDAGS